jgi:K+-sensing histidine kinase KdpD
MRLAFTRHDARVVALALAAVIAVTAGFRLGLRLTNPTTAALSYLLIVMVTGAVSTLPVAIAASVVADLCLNYFFMPPFGTFRIADPQNWVALVAFLGVSVIASNLSAAVRERERQANVLEAARKNEELKAALLASLAHDLRTPLTAIRVAASNLQSSWIGEADRRDQSDLILIEVERLTRLFQNILEMARIDAGAVAPERQWVHPSEIFEAARDHVEHALRDVPIDVAVDSDRLVRVDPRLTASALAHVLENAAQYAKSDAPIAVRLAVSAEGLAMSVRDHGRGIAPADLPHLFDRFYRGGGAKPRASGTGMGLAIARGMLMAEEGRIWAENCANGGAQFSIVVPADSRPAAAAEQTA